MVMFMCNNNIKNNVSHKNVSMLRQICKCVNRLSFFKDRGFAEEPHVTLQ